MPEIEIWCGQTCNRIYVGDVFAELPDNKVRLMSKWLDGSQHDITVEIEPGTLEKNDGGWFAAIRDQKR